MEEFLHISSTADTTCFVPAYLENRVIKICNNKGCNTAVVLIQTYHEDTNF